MGKSHLKLVAPAGKIPTVRIPVRRANKEYRTREHLTEAEVERLIDATSSHRDATMILLASRHGLRAAELVDLRSGRFQSRRPARPQGQERHTCDASLDRPGVA